jgi:glycosyltransferase involved in cell wall biosynthesis
LELPVKPVRFAGSDTFILRFTGSFCTDTLAYKDGFRGTFKRLLEYTPENIDFSGRTLIHLLKAINLLISRGDPIGKLIRVECFGVDTTADRQSVHDAGLEEIVSFRGYLPHSESIKLIKSADGLFLPLHGLAHGNRSRITPGKAYEYLATGRPILGCLPPGDARELVEKYSVGTTADPCNPEQIASALRKIVKFQQCATDENRLDDWISKYDRRNLTLRLVNFIDQLKKTD